MAARRRKPRSSRRRLVSAAVILLVALLIVVLRLVEEIGPERGPSDRFVVAKIIDGDTIELEGGDRLRLLAIDTPESGEPLYDEASAMLERLALGKTARIEFAGRRRDGYGRLLGYLFIDTLYINRVLIDSGLAYVYLFKDNDLSSPLVKALLEAQRGAIGRDVGLWSVEREPEAVYYAKDGSLRMHRPACSAVENLKPGRYQEFSTREEGLATGLSPCRNCKP
jgi:micrococcal nuclease